MRFNQCQQVGARWPPMLGLAQPHPCFSVALQAASKPAKGASLSAFTPPQCGVQVEELKQEFIRNHGRTNQIRDVKRLPKLVDRVLEEVRPDRELLAELMRTKALVRAACCIAQRCLSPVLHVMSRLAWMQQSAALPERKHAAIIPWAFPLRGEGHPSNGAPPNACMLFPRLDFLVFTCCRWWCKRFLAWANLQPHVQQVKEALGLVMGNFCIPCPASYCSVEN